MGGPRFVPLDQCRRCKGALPAAPKPPICGPCRRERDALIEQWQHLPPRVAMDLVRHDAQASRMGLDDLISVGNIALTHAAECWDPGRGVLFKTYAYSACLFEMKKESHSNRIIAAPRNLLYRTRKPSDTLADRVQCALQTGLVVHFSAMTADEADTLDHLADRPSDTHSDVGEEVDRLIAAAGLTKREEDAVRRILDPGGATWADMAASMDVSRQRFGQLVKSATDKIKAAAGVLAASLKLCS